MYVCNTRCNIFQYTEHNMSDNFKQWIISVLFWKRNATHGLKPAPPYAILSVDLSQKIFVLHLSGSADYIGEGVTILSHVRHILEIVFL